MGESLNMRTPCAAPDTMVVMKKQQSVKEHVTMRKGAMNCGTIDCGERPPFRARDTSTRLQAKPSFSVIGNASSCISLLEILRYESNINNIQMIFKISNVCTPVVESVQQC